MPMQEGDAKAEERIHEKCRVVPLAKDKYNFKSNTLFNGIHEKSESFYQLFWFF